MSEQVVVSMHANVKSKRVKLKLGPQYSDYGRKLTAFIVAFNFQNI